MLVPAPHILLLAGGYGWLRMKTASSRGALGSTHRQWQIESLLGFCLHSPLPSARGIVGPAGSCVHFIRKSLWAHGDPYCHWSVGGWKGKAILASLLCTGGCIGPVRKAARATQHTTQESPKIYIPCSGTLGGPTSPFPLAVTELISLGLCGFPQSSPSILSFCIVQTGRWH